MHRMVSVHSSDRGPSFSMRRRLLHEREKSWKHFRWHNKHSLDLLTFGSIYEFMGGFYGNVMGPDISFIELPSTTSTSQPKRSWAYSMPDLHIVDFTMDPSQDLLVILVDAPEE